MFFICGIRCHCVFNQCLFAPGIHCRRERENLLSQFEVDLDRSKVKERKLVTNSSLAVKEFVRSAAGTQLAKPSLLRPAPVLLETTDYLINR